jgi:hypothetical protein
MAGKAVGRPFFVRLERTFEGNRFAQEHERQAFDWLLQEVERLEGKEPRVTEQLPNDSREGVAA